MIPRASTPIQAGFTAMEMMIVIGIMALLATLAVPSLLGSMRNGRVNDACNSVTRVSSQARMMSRTRYDPTKYYGVIIVNDVQPGYVELTYGSLDTPVKGDILTTDLSAYVEGSTPANKVVTKHAFNRNVVVYDDSVAPAVPLAASRGWLYQYRTGYPIALATPTAKPTSVLNISMRSLDDKYRAALAIYEVGIANVANF